MPKPFLKSQEKLLDGMYLPVEKPKPFLNFLLEGNSVSSVERITEVHHTTILKLFVLAGERCERIMATKIRSVPARDLECDEVMGVHREKAKRVRPDDDPNLGDCYCFVAIERHTKLVLNIATGKRDQATTDVFNRGRAPCDTRQISVHYRWLCALSHGHSEHPIRSLRLRPTD